MAYTTIDNPELYFQNKAYTGDGNSNQAITFDGSENIKPDWVWIKTRGAAHQHTLIDSTRGVNKALLSNSSNSEDTDDQYGWLSSFNTNGFTTQDGSASDHWNVNKSGNTYISWNWVANGGTTSSDSNGSITSTVQANTTAGFSIVSYTGNGSAGATVGHGLGAVPSTIILKSRSTNGAQWTVYHKSLGNTKGMQLDTTAAPGTSTLYWNDTTPSSTVFTLGSGGDPNGSGGSLIAYCFAEKKGYSKFGQFTGNGNADGTFIYTGFRPAWVMSKRTDSTDGWRLKDAERSSFNPTQHRLLANASDAEVVASSQDTDFLSNGFKMRNTDSGYNGSGATYVYWAFAESPFVNSNGVPNNAR